MSGWRKKCTRERRGLRGCERKAAAVACVQFCDCVIKFSKIVVNVATIKSTCQYYFRASRLGW